MSLQVSFTADEAAWAMQFLESGGLLEPALDGARADAGLDPPLHFFSRPPDAEGLRDSETFGVESGRKDVIDWLNETARSEGSKFEARMYGQTVKTANFGEFDLFSWIGDVKQARRLVQRAGKRFRVRTVEGGYKPKERTFGLSRRDYALVRRGGKVVGRLLFEAPRIGGSWRVAGEERA